MHEGGDPHPSESMIMGFEPLSRLPLDVYDDLPGPLGMRSFSDEFCILLDMHIKNRDCSGCNTASVYEYVQTQIYLV